MRDQQISTITYLIDINGKLHKLCDFIGYGIPYATEYTNPQALIKPYALANEYKTLPQADPNGLFSPPSAAGTWVLCLDPVSEKLSRLILNLI